MRGAKAFMSRTASMAPSGYPVLNTRIKIANTPTKNPNIYFPVLVLDPVTGSVAMNTAANANPPKHI